MNILFLDVDGVLNSKQHLLMIKEQNLQTKNTTGEADLEYMRVYTETKNVWCLKYILECVPDLKIVISSAWRNHFELDQFKQLFKYYGMDGERIIGKTPRRMSSTRAEEIGMWLNDNSLQVGYEDKNQIGSLVNYVVLDDNPVFDLGDARKRNEILTDPWVGLTMQDAFKIVSIFKPEFVVPLLAI